MVDGEYILHKGESSDWVEKSVTVAKGSLLTFDSSQDPTLIPVGSDGQVIIADSAESGGFKWGVLSHTALSNIGTNTHAQIDTHLSNTSNPHTVTASQVGNTTAQWNANKLQGVDIDSTAPADTEVLTYDGSTSKWKPAAAGGGSINSLTSFMTDYTISNTTVESTISKIDIPANTLADGDFIEIRTELHIINNTANAEYVTIKLTDGTTTQILARSSDNAIYVGSNTDRLQEFIWFIRRDGSSLHVYFSRHGEQAAYFTQSLSTGASASPFYSNTANISYLVASATYGNSMTITPTFSEIITISWKFKWDTADALLSASFAKSRAFHFKV